ncbi:MAG TPA: hypothetical protein VGE52_11940 [Pirellulales bacterium]
MTTLSVTVGMSISGTETLGVNVPAATTAKRQVTHDQLNLSAALSNGSTPPVSEIVVISTNLAAGAKSIDLTAAPGTNGRVIDLTGLRLRAMKITNNGGAEMVVDHNASNAYNWNDASPETIAPGGVIGRYFGANNTWSPAVSSTRKILAIAGTGTDALTIELLFGT